MATYRNPRQPSRGTVGFQKAVGETPRKEVARLLRCDAGTVVHLLKGRRGPGLALGTRIHEVYGVAPRLWSIPLKSRPSEQGTLAKVSK